MEISKCRNAFEQGEKNRLACPLNSGVYKINNVRNTLVSWNSTIDMLKESKKAKRKPPNLLIHCTAGDAHFWLKSIPMEIAGDFMGYKIMPALLALQGDDVSEDRIEKLKAIYVPEINKLVDKCDGVEFRLRKNIGREYRNWLSGQSEIQDLINDALTIVDGILINIKPNSN